jgi:hypothetical protein
VIVKLSIVFIALRRFTCEEEKKPDGTSISVGTDGVDVSTKNGTSSTSVNVSGGKAKVG